MEAVIFDIDGTLLESSNIDGHLYNAAIEGVLGQVRIRDSWGAYTHVTDAGILEEMLLDNDINPTEAIITKVQVRFFELLSRYIEQHGAFPEVPGAQRFVESLRRADGVAIAYATGGWSAPARLKLQSAGFPLGEVPLATSDDSKVRAEIMCHALELLGNDFESVTYYGDSVWDRAASQALGWNFEAVGEGLCGIREYSARAT